MLLVKNIQSAIFQTLFFSLFFLIVWGRLRVHLKISNSQKEISNPQKENILSYHKQNVGMYR